MTSRIRLLVSAALVAVATAISVGGAPVARAQAADDPVIVVGGTFSPEFTVLPLRNRLADDGYDAYTFALPGGGLQDIALSSQALGDYVDTVLAQTGASQVDLVAHSQGGLVGRYYIKNLGGSSSVDSLVMLGAPNNGTRLANIAGVFGITQICDACEQMRRGSTFLNDLNAGDDTIGDVEYTNIYTAFDEVVFPARTARMNDGATNVKLQSYCWRIVGHIGLLGDGAVYDGVDDALQGRSIRPDCWKF